DGSALPRRKLGHIDAQVLTGEGQVTRFLGHVDAHDALEQRVELAARMQRGALHVVDGVLTAEHEHEEQCRERARHAHDAARTQPGWLRYHSVAPRPVSAEISQRGSAGSMRYAGSSQATSAYASKCFSTDWCERRSTSSVNRSARCSSSSTTVLVTVHLLDS